MRTIAIENQADKPQTATSNRPVEFNGNFGCIDFLAKSNWIFSIGKQCLLKATYGWETNVEFRRNRIKSVPDCPMSVSETKKPTTRKPRKPSQTARILENVEWLVSLYEVQGSHSTDLNLDETAIEKSVETSVKKLIDARLDKLEALLSAKTESATNFDSTQLEKSIESSVENIFEQKLGKLEKRLTSSLDSKPKFDSAGLEKSIEKAVAKLVDERSKQFEKRISKKLDSFAASQSTSPDTSESMDALIDLVSEQLTSQKDLIAKKLDSITETVTGATEPSDNNPDTEVMSLLSDFQAVIVGFKEKFESLEETIELQATAFEETTQDIQTNVGELIKQLASAAPIDGESVVEQDSDQSDSGSIVDNDPIAEASSHWQKQKEAMLAKYGIDPEYRPLEELKPEPEQETIAELETAAAEKLEDLHQTIDSISPEDKDAIEQLKRDLNSKLRDAEVELSINRARLSQERAEIEQKQSELEQRTSDLEAKLRAKNGDSADHNKKGGFMSRFTRHLGK